MQAKEEQLPPSYESNTVHDSSDNQEEQGLWMAADTGDYE